MCEEDCSCEEECYCDEDQGAGYTYQDEYGECDVCRGITADDIRHLLYIQKMEAEGKTRPYFDY